MNQVVLKLYLFFITPTVIANIITIWCVCLNCGIIPGHPQYNKFNMKKTQANKMENKKHCYKTTGNKRNIPLPIFTINCLNSCANGKFVLIIKVAIKLLNDGI